MGSDLLKTRNRIVRACKSAKYYRRYHYFAFRRFWEFDIFSRLKISATLSPSFRTQEFFKLTLWALYVIRYWNFRFDFLNYLFAKKNCESSSSEQDKYFFYATLWNPLARIMTHLVRAFSHQRKIEKNGKKKLFI